MICQDNSLYERINFQGLKVPTKFIEKVFEKGCKHLNLRNSQIEGELKLTKISKLKSLDLLGTQISEADEQNLLNSCDSLQKLIINSMNYFDITNPVLKKIG